MVRACRPVGSDVWILRSRHPSPDGLCRRHKRARDALVCRICVRRRPAVDINVYRAGLLSRRAVGGCAAAGASEYHRRRTHRGCANPALSGLAEVVSKALNSTPASTTTTQPTTLYQRKETFVSRKTAKTAASPARIARNAAFPPTRRKKNARTKTPSSDP